MLRLYIVPEIGTGVTGDPLRAKYLDTLGPYGATGQMRYGFQPIRLVGSDFTAQQDAFLVAQSDVSPFPFDLTANVGGGGVTAARAMLELALIPAQWVNGAMPWMQVAKMVAGMFQFMNRLKGYLPTLLIDNATKLNVQWGSIPVDTQNGIIACAQSFGYSTAFIAANTQLRVILENFATAWGVPPIFVGPVVLQ
jgi:hypothetical protein